MGEQPDQVDPAVPIRGWRRSGPTGNFGSGGHATIRFSVDDDIVLHRRKRLEFHTNGMVFQAMDAAGQQLERREYYSVGGGFVLDEDETGTPVVVTDPTPVPYPFTHRRAAARELAAATGLPISDLMLANEQALAQRGGHPRRAAADLAGHAGLRGRGCPTAGCCPAA